MTNYLFEIIFYKCHFLLYLQAQAPLLADFIYHLLIIEMTELHLPPIVNSESDSPIPGPILRSRQITIVGANGSGKSRFMDYLIRTLPERAFVLSAIKAFYPETSGNTLEGSVDRLFSTHISRSRYLRAESPSELDKLIFMLLDDEFDYLLSVKSSRLRGNDVAEHPTRLDKLVELWEEIFPGNRILQEGTKLLFSTEAGDDVIASTRLSHGEKAVLYYIAGVLYAMPGAVIFIDAPTRFLHPSILYTLWNAIENLRPDCTFVYITNDADFVSTRTENVSVWVKKYDSEENSWDYEVLPPGDVREDLFFNLIGTRRPILFIEGDATHSLDSKLYTLVFSDYVVRPLGSCDKVIESTRTFRDLNVMHHLESTGIVDRDRRTDQEIAYLRRKNIFVPDVAEVENIFLLESVIRAMATARGKDPEKVFIKVKQQVFSLWKRHLKEQVMMHVRHRVKRTVEYRIDGKFNTISEMEEHIKALTDIVNPKKLYDEIHVEFASMVPSQDYEGILRVFNHKPMLSETNVAGLLGFPGRDAYIRGVLNTIKQGGKASKVIKDAVKYSLGMTACQLAANPPLQPKPKVKKVIEKTTSPEIKNKKNRPANKNSEESVSKTRRTGHRRSH